jgi:hypothetical protein
VGRSPPFTLFWLPCGVQRANVADLGGKHRFSVLRQTALSPHSVANYRLCFGPLQDRSLRLAEANLRIFPRSLRSKDDSPRPRSASRPSTLLREPPVAWPFYGRLAPFGLLRVQSANSQPKLVLARFWAPFGSLGDFPPTEVDFSPGVGLLAKSVRRSVIRGRFPVSTVLRPGSRDGVRTQAQQGWCFNGRLRGTRESPVRVSQLRSSV